jgi:hypothetical protein
VVTANWCDGGTHREERDRVDHLNRGPRASPTRIPLALSNEQIDRYSRQIIVPGVGGAGQEKLLESHLVVIGDAPDIELVLAYLAGAGVGRIDLVTIGSVPTKLDAAISRMRDLNPDVKLTNVSTVSSDAALILAIVGSPASLEAAATLGGRHSAAVVLARLDTPAKIALLLHAPPCVACADAGLLASFTKRSGNSAPIAMVAATEALKFLVGYSPASGTTDFPSGTAPASGPALIEFRGYESSKRALHAAENGCSCSGNRAGSTR